MANRRQGYGGGRSYYNSGPVNPWQVGNAPGNQGGQFNNGNQSNLLSQLSEPHAQLALAITKLLQPQQQVPSLLTMNTINPLHNSGGYGPNNYPHRGRGNMNNRRPRPDMKPYNKMNSRNNRDTDFNRRRANLNKKTQPQQRSTVVSKPKKPSSTKASSKSPGKTTEVKKSPTVIEDKDEKPSAMDTTETAVKETDDKSEDTEQSDKKRDWKEEKNENDEESKPDVVTIEESDDANENEKEKEDENEKDKEKTTEETSQADSKSGKYDGIPKELLHCHICQKKMWNAESFAKHMHGRAHQHMFEKVEESYRIKADMMRESIRLTEEKHNIEMDRMKRLGKKTKTQQLSRCAMCDLDFYGQLFVHRKSASHQKLKHFLHPRCSYCNKEFPTRMEWENHRHTAEHLRKKAENGDKKKPSKSGSTGTDDEGILVEDECFVVIDSAESDDHEEPNAITDLTDDLGNDPEIQIPSYKPNRAVGLSLITPISGFFCKPCNRFFPNEKVSQQHAQSMTHFEVFVNILNEKVAENEEKKRKIVETEGEDDEGNWKRRKTVKDDEEVEKEDKEDVESKIDETAEEDTTKTENGEEFYDPSETFTTTDPNDICLDNTNIENSTLNEDVWQEVDTKIDEILEQTKTEPEPQPVPPPTQSQSPTKPAAKPAARPQRAIRGRKN